VFGLKTYYFNFAIVDRGNPDIEPGKRANASRFFYP